jgi:hypothetical protein
MGGERGSTARMRLAGQICCNCKVFLAAPHTGRETYCARCAPKRKVYFYFMLLNGWHCQFLEPDLKTSAAGPLILTSPEKIMELARRGGAAMKLEDVQAIEYGISMGRGSVWLNLTDEQYRKLKRRGIRS